MDTVSKEDNGAPIIRTDDEEHIERTLKRLSCAPAGERLMNRLVQACDSAGNNDGALAEPVREMKQFCPVEVSSDQISKWAGLMNDAARQGTEKRLGKLTPAGMGDFSKMRCSVAMDLASSSEPDSSEKHQKGVHSGRKWISRRTGGIAASIILLISGLGFLFQDGDGGFDGLERLVDSGGKFSKSVGISSAELNRKTLQVVEEGVNWNNELGEAQMQYRVDFEDSVEMRDEKGQRVVVSVPKSQKVVVPVKVY